jgi:hypothetical protein
MKLIFSEINLVFPIICNMTKPNNTKECMDSYVNALNEFNALIEQGWAKPRGYNLQTIDEVGFPTPFNEGI